MARLWHAASVRDAPPIDRWSPWTPDEAARRLAGVGVTWSVVGGWAIDLFLGTQTRDHHDLEIAVQRADAGTVHRHFGDHDVYVVKSGQLRRLGAGEEPPADVHQTWLHDPDADAWRMDVMLEPGDEDTWVFRRDERIEAPRASMVGRTDRDIPFLRPQGALLYKAKSRLPKDEADLHACLPRLDEQARAWLASAIERAHPGHPWLDRLR
jgi:hypothetical protein